MKRSILAALLAAASLAAFAQAAKPAPMRVVAQLGHPSWVGGIAASPDGSLVATAGGRDSSVKLWTKEGILVATMGGHERPAVSLRFSPDGSRLASLGEEGILFVWGLRGERLHQLADATMKIKDFEFTPDGQSIVACSNLKDRNLLFFDYRQGKLAASYPLAMPDPINKYQEWQELEPSPDGKTLLIVTNEESMLADYRGAFIRKLKMGESGGTIRFTPDGSSLLELSRGSLARYDLASGKWTTIKEKIEGRGYALSRDGKTVAVPMKKRVELLGLDGTAKGALESNLKEWSGTNVLAFHPNGSAVYSGDETGGYASAPCLSIWDFANKSVAGVSGLNNKVLAAQFRSSDGRLVVIGSESGISTFSADLQFEGGASLQSLDRKLALTAGFDPTGEFFAVEEFGKLHIYDSRSLALLRSPSTGSSISGMGGLSLGPRGESFLLNTATETQYWQLEIKADPKADPKKIDWGQGDTIYGRMSKDEHAERSKPAAAFSPDGSAIALGCFAIDLVDRATLNKTSGREDKYNQYSHYYWWGPQVDELVASGGDSIFKTPNRMFDVLAFSPDGKTLAAARWDKTIDLYDMQGKLLKTLPGHDNYVRGLSFSPDGRLLVSSGDDSHVKLWNLESGELVNLVVARGEWLAYTPDGYFDASRGGGSLVALVKGESSAYGIDQFAAQYNRPDIILERLGSRNAALAAHYREQYARRLAKLGLAEGELSSEKAVPTVALTKNRVAGKFLELELAIAGGDADLKSYNVYVNDNPVWGARGKAASGRSLAASERIELTAGRNKVEVTALNAAGAESYRALYWADCAEAGPKPDLYYLGFGVSQYQDPSLNLKYAAKDAADLAKLFVGMKKQYGKIVAKAYLDKEVTKAAMAQAKELLAGAKPEDVFVLFIAGHGVHDADKAATYYYLGHEAKLGDLAGSAIPFEEVEELLQGVAPRQKLFLMDTCESGEAEEAGTALAKDFVGKKGVAARAVRGIAVRDKGGSPGLAGTYKRDQYIYNDVRRRSGAIVFSSCRGGEYSFESDSVKNGYFTSAILASFKDPKADADKDKSLSLGELRSYVGAQVPEKTAGMQHPTVDRDNLYLKFGFSLGK
ncbi:MAG TPA: caspase family protein [Spirochaetia bacterium]|nr:caspase family protein [Spirochaetia bacterium]HRZ66152.1 caspase family protein [Spirochaetia bacterium]